MIAICVPSFRILMRVFEMHGPPKRAHRGFDQVEPASPDVAHRNKTKKWQANGRWSVDISPVLLLKFEPTQATMTLNGVKVRWPAALYSYD